MNWGLRSRLTTLVTVAALAFSSCAAAQSDGTAPLEPGVAHQASHDAAATALTARIRTLATSSDTPGLVALARSTLDNASLAAPARERVLYEAALALAALELTPDAQTLLTELAARPPEVQVWRYDDEHRMARPLYDVAAAARYAARRGDERRATQSALDAIARGTDDALTMLDDAAAAHDDGRQRATLQAFA